jgi:hypothetical protein
MLSLVGATMEAFRIAISRIAGSSLEFLPTPNASNARQSLLYSVHGPQFLDEIIEPAKRSSHA